MTLTPYDATRSLDAMNAIYGRFFFWFYGAKRPAGSRP
jgi:hypothetical protein